MNSESAPAVEEVRSRLVDLGGKMSHDLGLGRIVGQILVYLYLQEDACSLDRIGKDLGLSKAAVSIAARQLESFGLLRRVWVKGERKLYYRTADNIASAIRQGLLAFVRQKLDVLGSELDHVNALLESKLADADPDTAFLYARTKRAQVVRHRIAGIVDSRLLRILSKL